MTSASLRPIALVLSLSCGGQQALTQTLPQNPTVANGSAVINTFSDGMQIINSPGAIINWDGFSIDAARTVRFDQVNAASAVLNRVTGNRHSQIDGQLQSNGRVFLINANGIVFGGGSRVDTAGLIASTLNMSDDDFLAGNYRFACSAGFACEGGVDVLNPVAHRVVLRDGSQITTRTAGPGGQVWLIAKDRVESEKGSLIDAPNGQAIAAAAREVTIGAPQLGQMTFTLNGTAGSRIDLLGKIDASRGAAGFFADTVRLGGTVRAKSEMGAVGQISAQASSNLIVDEDARLDVSGTLAADAGTVRLNAVQKISVASSALIDASGLHELNGGGGLGGLIELTAGEVVLPAPLLGTDGGTAIQLDVHSRRTGGIVDARSGRVRINETGEFTYGVVDGRTIELSGETRTTRTRVNLNTVADSTSSTGEATRRATAAAGDGTYLVITERRTTNTSIVANSDRGGSAVTIWEAILFNRDGQALSTRVIDQKNEVLTRSNSSFDDPGYNIYGLSKGGYIITQGNNLTFFGRDTSTTIVIDNLRQATLRPLLGGGLLVTTSVDNVPVQRVYGAGGTLIPDVAAALVDEKIEINPATNASTLNFDGRTDVRFNSAFQLRVFNRPAGATERQLAEFPSTGNENTSIAARVNQSGVYLARRFFPQGQEFRNRARLGIVDATGDTLLAEGFQRQILAEGGAGVVLDHRKEFGGFVVLDSNRIAFATDDTLLTFDAQTVSPTLSRSSSTTTDKLTLAMIERRNINVPFAETTASGALAVPLLLATQAGQSNGVRTGGSTTPVTPTTPTTPTPVTPTTPTPTPTTPTPITPTPTTPTPTTPTNPTPPTLDPVTPPVVVPPNEPVGQLPPPYRPPSSATPTDPSPPGFSVPRGQARRLPAADPDMIDPEVLESTRNLVRDMLGDDELARFDRAEGRDKSVFMEKVALGQVLGKELFETVRNMEPQMQVMLFTSLSRLQAEGLHMNDKFSEGLNRALTVPVYTGDNADGSRGPTRTALFAPLSILEAELAQANQQEWGKADRDRVQNKITRELIIAGMEAAGEDVNDAADVVFTRPDGTQVRINEDGDVSSGPNQLP